MENTDQKAIITSISAGDFMAAYNLCSIIKDGQLMGFNTVTKVKGPVIPIYSSLWWAAKRFTEKNIDLFTGILNKLNDLKYDKAIQNEQKQVDWLIIGEGDEQKKEFKFTKTDERLVEKGSQEILRQMLEIDLDRNSQDTKKIRAHICPEEKIEELPGAIASLYGLIFDKKPEGIFE